MTEKVLEYLRLGKYINSDVAESNYDLYCKKANERKALRDGMSVDELKSLHGNIPEQTFSRVFIPLIKQREAETRKK